MTLRPWKGDWALRPQSPHLVSASVPAQMFLPPEDSSSESISEALENWRVWGGVQPADQQPPHSPMPQPLPYPHPPRGSAAPPLAENYGAPRILADPSQERRSTPWGCGEDTVGVLGGWIPQLTPRFLGQGNVCAPYSSLLSCFTGLRLKRWGARDADAEMPSLLSGCLSLIPAQNCAAG